LWSLEGLLAHPALELAFAEMVVVDVALKGPGVGGCLVAYVAAVLVARRLVHRVHVLLQSGEMAQPGATYLALHGIGLGTRLLGMFQLVVLFEIRLRANGLAALIADDG